MRRTKLDGTDLFSDSVQISEGLTVDYTFEDLQPGYEYVLSVRPDSAQYQEESTRQRTSELLQRHFPCLSNSISDWLITLHLYFGNQLEFLNI